MSRGPSCRLGSKTRPTLPPYVCTDVDGVIQTRYQSGTVILGRSAQLPLIVTEPVIDTLNWIAYGTGRILHGLTGDEGGVFGPKKG